MLPRTEPDEPDATEPIDRDERLGEAIEAYLELAEGGNGPPDPEEFARGYPDLGDDLIAALEGLALVRGLVGESSGPGHRLEEGRRVAGYRIVRELGRGGMGIVYEAVHVGLDRPVALKVLGTQAAPDSSGRRRFLNEAKTAAGLHHTHIVPVFDVGQVGGLCYYAMQRIEGSGLDRVLRHLRRDRSVAAGSTHGSASGRPGQAAASRSRPTPRTKVKPNLDASLAFSGLGRRRRRRPRGGASLIDEPPDVHAASRLGLLPVGRRGRPAGGRGAGARPPARGDPPRHQALEPPDRRPGNGLGRRLRPGPPPGRPEPDAVRQPAGHPPLHEPRAGQDRRRSTAGPTSTAWGRRSTSWSRSARPSTARAPPS